VTFAALALLGAAIVGIWSAVTNENPLSAAGAVLRGEPQTTTPLFAPVAVPPPATGADVGAAPSSGSGGRIPMVRPHPGPTTSGYGPRTAPTAGASSYHRGLDIDGDTGDPIVAAAGGTVIRSFYSSGYGNRVEIDHGDGIVTSYSHMQNGSRVPTGRRIATGERVGLMDTTGISTGSHLHFEVIVNGTKVDPAPWIGDRGGPEDDTRGGRVPGAFPPVTLRQELGL